MAEAVTSQCGEVLNWTADGTYTKGDVIQVPDGRAGVVLADATVGQVVGVDVTRGAIYELAKTTSMVLLVGGRAYWDHSANKVSFRKVNDRDFLAGALTADATSSATTCFVALNVHPRPDIDMLNRDGALSVATGTQAAGGFGLPQVYGGSRAFKLTATSEPQCVDMLSVDKFLASANWIAEFQMRFATNGSGSASDLSIGVADGTSTSDADAIVTSVFFHFDGNDLNIYAESDDGTTEVAATDTTVDFVAGSAVANRVEFWLDGRDTDNVKYYIDGVEVLAATSNLGKITAAVAASLGLLVHYEKSTGTETGGPVYIDRAECRLQQ